VSVESCPCTEEDWECDFGFYKKIEGGECVPITEGFSNQVLSKPPKNCKGTYRKSQGYKKIPGDQCEGGVYLGPIDIDCPGENTEKN
jgi:Sortilin, neurotensin receptor 3, C-terminal